MKKIGVLTSGGDAPGMNAAIRAVVRSGISSGMEVYGVYDGYKGLVDGKIEKLEARDVSDIIIKGGTILGTARLDEFKLEHTREIAVKNLKELGIEGLVVIGGDGSYKGALELTKLGIPCVCLPGTIDNDVVSTDYTIGFDTALNTIIENVDKLRDTSSSHHRCSVIEVMGNRCGDLALFAGITCGAEIVITKETGYDENEVLMELRKIDQRKKKRHAIVLISEKITDVDLLADKISNNTDFSGRATVLGHIQRGGSPTARDRILATMFGDQAVRCLAENIGGVCIGLDGDEFKRIPIEEALIMPRKSRKQMFELQKKLV